MEEIRWWLPARELPRKVIILILYQKVGVLYKAILPYCTFL